MAFLAEFAVTFCFVLGLLLAIGLLLMALTQMSGRRRRHRFAREIAKAPTIDLLMALVTVVPWLLGLVIVGWHGLFAALLAQVVAVEGWAFGEGIALRRAGRRPRPSRFAEARVGRWRSRAGQWLVVLVLMPGLWMIRLGQVLIWPLVQKTLRQQVSVPADRWVRVSRRQTAGVIGRDRLWAWFSEWALGIAATGVDMLGALEALWMPVRFRSAAKNRRLAAALPGLLTTWLRPSDLAGEPDEVTERLQACHDAMTQPAWMTAPPPNDAAETTAVAGERVGMSGAGPVGCGGAPPPVPAGPHDEGPVSIRFDDDSEENDVDAAAKSSDPPQRAGGPAGA